MNGSTVYITAAAGSPGPTLTVGCLSVLERRVREARRAKAARILVACPGPLPAELEAVVERTAAPAPDGAVVVRADELAGVLLDSPRAARRAEWAYLQGMQKSFQGLTDAYVNHHFSLRLTRLVANVPAVTPNHITMVTILVGVVLSLAIAFGGPTGVIVGAVLLQVHNVLDSCDGELARLRFASSKVGMWLDAASDDICDAGFVAAIGWVAGGAWWHLALVVTALRVYQQADMYRHVIWKLGGDLGAFRWWYEQGKGSLDEVYASGSWTTVFRAFFRRDTYALLWAIFAIAGWYPVILVYALVIFGSQAVTMAIHSVKTA
jgi:phosphatidylglycerophosphate synthase